MSENIVIGDVRPRIQALGDGVQSTFVYPFAIFKETDLEVYLDDVLQLSGYSVNGAGQSAGGSVVFNTPPAANVVVTLRRYLKIERMSDFAEGGAFHAAVINQELDYLVALSQQNAEEIVRSVKLDPTDGDAGLILPLKDQRANACLVFDQQGSPVVGPAVDDIAQAQSNAEIAAQAAADASGSASMAETERLIAQTARDVSITARDQAISAAQHTFSIFTFSAQGGETSFKGLDDAGKPLLYTPGVILVDLNGALLEDGVDFVAINGYEICGFMPLSTGDVLTLRAFGSFSVTAEMDDIKAESARQVETLRSAGLAETTNMQTYAQQMADIVNNVTAGAFFNLDGNGDVMPALTPLHSKMHELDVNGDIQPL